MERFSPEAIRLWGIKETTRGAGNPSPGRRLKRPEREGVHHLQLAGKTDHLSGCSKMPRYKAPEIPRNETYSEVRRNNEE